MNQQHPQIKTGRSFAALKNVTGCMRLVNRLIDRPPNTVGIGVMFGPSGFGKTEAAKFARSRTRGIKIDVYDSWNRRTFVQAVLSEAGYPNQRGTIAELMKQACMVLGDDPTRPLIIDEADTAFEKGFLGLIRELHDVSRVAVLLVGEELFPKRLETIERFHNRIQNTFGAEECDLADCRKLADLFCPDLAIDDELLDHVRTVTGGRARRIVNTLLQDVTEFARNAGLTALTLKTYGGGYSTNETPRRAARAAQHATKGAAA